MAGGVVSHFQVSARALSVSSGSGTTFPASAITDTASAGGEQIHVATTQLS